MINLAADLGAMGAALELLIGGPGQLYTPLFGVVCIVLEVWLSYPRYAAILKWTTLSLFSYVAVVFVADVPWGTCAEVLIRSQHRTDRSVRDGHGGDPRYDFSPICSSGRQDNNQGTANRELNQLAANEVDRAPPWPERKQWPLEIMGVEKHAFGADRRQAPRSNSRCGAIPRS